MKKLNITLKKTKIPKFKKTSMSVVKEKGESTLKKNLKSLNKNDIIKVVKIGSKLKEDIKPFGKK